MSRPERRAASSLSSRPAALRAAVAGAALFGALLVAPGAGAQIGFGGPGGPGGPPGGSAPPKPPPGQETHAAGGGDDAQKLPTTEPTLPADPLALPTSVKTRIGTDGGPERETGLGSKFERDFYGLYYAEKSGAYSFKTLFPLWAERKQPNDRASMFGPLYYNRRSTEVDADVAFPFFWKLRDGATFTTIVGPFLHRESEGRPASGDRPKEIGRHDNWVAPLMFEGKTDDGGGYFHVPPLLTFTHHTDRNGTNVVGPLFCKWKGGPSCDPRSAEEIDLGVAPFYFYGRDDRTEYELVPPLLHYYHYSDVGDESLNVWGPLMWQHSRESDVFNVLPVFWHNWGKNEDHVTVFPLFHYGYKGASNLLVTPLFLSATGDKGEKTFVTWGYARHRGRTELDMWTPFWWNYRDPDIGLDTKLFFPFFYKSSSPRNDDLAILPLFAHFERPNIRETTWITPFFRHQTDLTGWETDILPIFYMGRENRSTHLVVAPILWDFASPKSHSTVVLPAFYRFADTDSTSQLVLNTYYHEKKVAGGRDWEVHFFPFFSYGESPTGHWWNFLYGMAGYTRDGTMSKMRALYIPITLSE